MKQEWTIFYELHGRKDTIHVMAKHVTIIANAVVVDGISIEFNEATFISVMKGVHTQ